MSVEDHKSMIRHLFEEALNQRNVAVIDELFAPDFVNSSAWPGQAPDLLAPKRVSPISSPSSLTSTLHLKASSPKGTRSLHARRGMAPIHQLGGPRQA